MNLTPEDLMRIEPWYAGSPSTEPGIDYWPDRVTEPVALRGRSIALALTALPPLDWPVNLFG